MFNALDRSVDADSPHASAENEGGFLIIGYADFMGPMKERSAREWLSASKSKGMSLGLSRVNDALEALGRPDRDMDCIRVAGSN